MSMKDFWLNVMLAFGAAACIGIVTYSNILWVQLFYLVGFFVNVGAMTIPAGATL